MTSAVLRILRNPRSGTSMPIWPDRTARHSTYADFKVPKHLVFYSVEGNDVLILRVLHGARDLESLF